MFKRTLDGFAGIQPISGTINFTPTVGGQFKYSLRCSGAGGSSDAIQTVIASELTQSFSGQLSKSNATSANIFGNYNPIVGSFLFTTGVWNATASTYHSAAITGTVDLKNEKIINAQFDWEAISSNTPGVVMYSNFTLGKHPGMTYSSSSKFPVLISDLKPMIASGSVRTICLTICAYGTIFDVFVMKNANATPQEVGLEIIISLDNTDDGPQPQFYVGQIVVNNITFNVYRNAFGSNFDTSWNNVIYRAARGTPYTNMQLNISDFVKDSVNRGYAKSGDYLMSVEIGTEVINGKGQTLIENFQLN